ncbi:MAG TPA: protein kinase, partial [Casimicrobiaceae bacterium]|nr:protein kinase [Casimicrobiaceae bacterium]
DATTLTMTGMVIGTPSYMAPEQCRGVESDGRADLFSVGVVLYELVTGTRPFDGSIEAIAYRICHERHRPASERAPIALPPGLDAVIDRALAKDAADRFPDAQSFEAALQAVVAGVADASGSSEATVINLADVPLAAPTAPAFDEALLATIERQLVRFVGPMARILVRQAVARARDTHELCTILGEHISDASERARFETKAQAAEPSGAQRVPTVAAKPTGAAASASVPTSTHASRPLEPAFVDQTTARLAVYLGPIARVIARKAAQQTRDCDEFVELVAQHIGTQDRHAFLRDMREKQAQAQGQTPNGL